MDGLIIVLIGLVLMGIQDYKSHDLSTAGLIIFGFVALGYVIFHSSWSIGMAGLIPGAVFLVIGKLTKQIGSGDGLVIGEAGMIIGLVKICEVIMLALFVCAFWGGVLCMMKRKKRNDEMPFVSFLAFAQIILCAFTIVERSAV